ncbi:MULTISPECIES: helix-turn-helix transcriptional regulator [Pseudomonas]|uniref:helix-turn-helix transcriptional regulator n=1 Tax=Pseudomonas TaxID=286 RepID=UPI000F77CE65|nr:MULTISPECIES: helix-turn-helix transcriptional regulator [Pseudomonas]RRW43182.1 XRE family transcriptional regulator [Pseudomonas luteola]
MSDEAICSRVGERIKKLRLEANISQAKVTEETGIARQTLINLESHGKGTLATMVAVLRAIGALERLSSLLEDVRPSPIKVMQMGGKIRERASSTHRVVKVASILGTPTTVKKKPKGSDW